MSDGHSRIVLSKVLTSTYKVRMLLFAAVLGSKYFTECSFICDESSGGINPSIFLCERLDPSTTSDSTLRYLYGRVRNVRTLSRGSLRINGNTAASCGDATYGGSSGRDRASALIKVRLRTASQ